MNIITDLPHEIYFVVANYLTLSDLATLLFTCKRINQQIGNDYPLQKVFRDNTPMKNVNVRCMHRKFVLHHVTAAIKNNWPEGILMGFDDLRYTTILAVLQVNMDRVSREMNKGILNKIHTSDADQVLGYIIDNFTESASACSKRTFKEEMVFFLYILAQRFIDTKIVTSGKIPPKLPVKSLKRVLDLLNKYRDYVLEATLIIDTPRPFDEGLLYLKTLRKLSEIFPEHAFDFSSPVNSSVNEKFVAGHKIPFLEYAVLSQNLEIFSYLAETNDVDPEGRYMALAYHVNNAGLIKYIERRNIGQDSNTLPDYIPEKPTSVLAGFIKREILTDSDYFEIERILILKKFKLTPEEEREFSSLPETSIERKVLKCLQTENYSPFANLEKDFETESAQKMQLEFQNPESYSCLTLTRPFTKFNYNLDPNMVRLGEQYFGSFNTNGSSLICTSEKKRFYHAEGSYIDYSFHDEVSHKETFRFIVFRMFDGALAVCADNDSMSLVQRLGVSMRVWE
jgi:hypothetical protein